MTNEEKASEIAKYCSVMPPTQITQADVLAMTNNAAMQAMEWKDEQMKEALNNILIECDACFDEQTTNTLESIIKHQISLL